jgi:hypothetical protein
MWARNIKNYKSDRAYNFGSWNAQELVTDTVPVPTVLSNAVSCG